MSDQSVNESVQATEIQREASGATVEYTDVRDRKSTRLELQALVKVGCGHPLETKNASTYTTL